MTDDEDLTGNDRFQVRPKIGGALRVADLKNGRVDGYWYMEEEEFVEICGNCVHGENVEGDCTVCGGTAVIIR